MITAEGTTSGHAVSEGKKSWRRSRKQRMMRVTGSS